MFKLVLRNKVKFPLKPGKRETSDVPHQTPLSWTENISSVLSLSSPGNSSKNRKFHKHFPVPVKSSNTVLSLNADVLIHRVPPELKRTGFRGYMVPGTFRWKQRGAVPAARISSRVVSAARLEGQTGLRTPGPTVYRGRGFLPVAPKTPWGGGARLPR